MDLRWNVDTLQNEIDRLLNERSQLQQFVSRFKNSNRRYLKIKDAAEEHVNRLLTDEETLLDLALTAVIEALRMNPVGMPLFMISSMTAMVMYSIVVVLIQL